MVGYIFLIVAVVSAGTASEAPQCGPGEMFAKYCQGGNNPITKCSDYLNYPWTEPEHSCTEGCVCSGSKLRDANGKCIESNDCPELFQCKNDPNAESSCGRFCNRRCPGQPTDPDTCNGDKNCDSDGCECVAPYLYDSQTKRCVKPEACSKVCGPGEVFSNDCIGAGCSATQCYEVDRKPGCIDVIGSACVRGCICADGKLRAQNGTCVLPEQCPPKSEEYCRYPFSKPGCGNNCDRRCNTNSECNKDCVPKGCDCIPPFVYDENSGDCVPQNLCPAQIN